MSGRRPVHGAERQWGIDLDADAAPTPDTAPALFFDSWFRPYDPDAGQGLRPLDPDRAHGLTVTEE